MSGGIFEKIRIVLVERSFRGRKSFDVSQLQQNRIGDAQHKQHHDRSTAAAATSTTTTTTAAAAQPLLLYVESDAIASI
jgi:hypothetical protein